MPDTSVQFGGHECLLAKFKRTTGTKQDASIIEIPLPAGVPLGFEPGDEGPLIFKMTWEGFDRTLSIPGLQVERVIRTDAENPVGVWRVVLVDRRIRWGQGFLTQWRFNLVDEGSGAFQLDTVKDDGTPYSLADIFRLIVARLPFSPEVKRIPVRWEQTFPKVVLERFMLARKAIEELLDRFEGRVPARITLHLDNSVGFYEIKQGTLGFSEPGDVNNSSPLDATLLQDREGFTQGFQDTFAAQGALVSGGERFATVAVDCWEPVILIDGKPVPILGGLSQLQAPSAVEAAAQVAGVIGASDVVNIEWLKRFVLRPESFKSTPYISKADQDILKRDAFKLWRLPGADTHNRHLLPIRNRCERNESGARLKPLIETFRWSYVWRAHSSEAPDQFRLRVALARRALIDTNRRISELISISSGEVARRLLQNAGIPDPSTPEGRARLLQQIQDALSDSFSDQFGAPDFFQSPGDSLGGRILDRLGEATPDVPLEQTRGSGGDETDTGRGSLGARLRRADRARDVVLRNLSGLVSGLTEAQTRRLGGIILDRGRADILPFLRAEDAEETAGATAYNQALRRLTQLEDSSATNFFRGDAQDLARGLIDIADRVAAEGEGGAAVQIDSLRNQLARAIDRIQDTERAAAEGRRATTRERSPQRALAGPRAADLLPRTVDTSARVVDVDLGLVRTSNVVGWLTNPEREIDDGNTLIPKPLRVTFGTHLSPRRKGVRVPTGVPDVCDDIFPPQIFEVLESGKERLGYFSQGFTRLRNGGAVPAPVEDLPPETAVVRDSHLKEFITLDGESNLADLEREARDRAEDALASPLSIDSERRIYIGPWGVNTNGVVASVEIRLREGLLGIETDVAIGRSIGGGKSAQERQTPVPRIEDRTRERGDL